MGDLRWVQPPGWPPSPPGWQPPAGWRPHPSWPSPPVDWVWWQVGRPLTAAWVSADGTRRIYRRGVRRWVHTALAVSAGGLSAMWVSEFQLYGAGRVVYLVGVLIATGTLIAGIQRLALVVAPGCVTVRRALWTVRVRAQDVVRF